MRAILCSAVLVAACCPATPPPTTPGAAGATTADPTPSTADDVGWACARYGVMGLYGVQADPGRATHAAFAIAQREYDLALAAGDDRGAAGHYLACAQALRAVPDDDWQRADADANADVCYYNAAVAFANAGRFAAEGRAALEQAAVDDPRLAPKLHEYLAEPLTDCAAP